MSIEGVVHPAPDRRAHPRFLLEIAVLVGVAIAVGSIVMLSTGTAHADEADAIEFAAVGAPSDVAPIVDDSAAGSARSRFVSVDSGELAVALSGPDVTIELFDDVLVPFGGSGVMSVGEEGQPTWSATTPEAVATLSFADDGVRGTISVGPATYSILPASGSTHLIFEEGRVLPNETEAIAPPADVLGDSGDLSVSGTSASDAASVAPLEVDPQAVRDGSAPVIRVLTVYDDNTRTYLGGDAPTVAWLSATIDEVNAAYARSGVNAVMQSASIEHVDYAGAGGSANIELNRITGKSDGYLDGVHARRDVLGADLVVFVVPLEASTCGQAWLLTPPVTAGDAAFGFSVVRPDCARANLTFAHETGHNLGAGHGPPEPPGVVPYANGYRNAALGYRTIMAYDDTTNCAGHTCKRLPYFSSPTVLYNGQPTGSPTQDNARVLNELAPFVAAYRTSGFVSLTPSRLLDTRGSGKVGSADGSAGPVVLNVLGKGGLPGSGVGAVALNVTVAEGESPVAGGGFVTVFPCGVRPDASNLNFVGGQTVPNSVIAPVSGSGEVCFYVYGRAHLLVDVSGYFPTGSGIVSLTPSRLLETRGSGKVGSADGSAGPVVLNVLGKGGLPGSGVGAVALNVTVAEGESPVAGGGFVTVFPCGVRPDASNLNFVGGQTVPNSVIAPVSGSGEVCFYVYGRAHLLVDVSGYFPTGSGIVSLTPSRLLDTRGSGKVGSADGSAGPVVLNVLGKGGLPGSGVGAVALNVTVAEGESPVAGGGFVTVFPCGVRPDASNLNFVGGQTVPNSVIAPVSGSGEVCFYVYGRAHLLVDVSGYFPT